jgi:lactoylglutathione lyase
VNSAKGFSSYFLSFETGCRLEIMTMESMSEEEGIVEERNSGISHMAISVGTKQNVDNLTESLRKNGFIVASDPRETGDGYYESVVLDPDGNRVEITV